MTGHSIYSTRHFGIYMICNQFMCTYTHQDTTIYSHEDIPTCIHKHLYLMCIQLKRTTSCNLLGIFTTSVSSPASDSRPARNIIVNDTGRRSPQVNRQRC
eukprot:GHVQ01004560.1.p1 GENE.GHVQ01004560.1~~GHVQ01004560.1.p1  ORF type:complete len:100 (-),score=1.04 GHVQ01004560.1:66-365(-)